MPTIEQMRRDIVSKTNELERHSRKLKELTRKRATQQGQVTKKENLISQLDRRSNLSANEITNLESLKRDLLSDRGKLINLKIEERNCSQQETDLLFAVGRLKKELSIKETSGAIDCSLSKSSYRGRFGAN